MTSDDDNDDNDDDDEMLMLTSDYRCAVKCYVLFVEVATRQGTDVVLTDHCKSKVTVESTLHFQSHVEPAYATNLRYDSIGGGRSQWLTMVSPPFPSPHPVPFSFPPFFPLLSSLPSLPVEVGPPLSFHPLPYLLSSPIPPLLSPFSSPPLLSLSSRLP